METVVRKLLEDARENGAFDAVVVEVPENLILENGGLVGEDDGSSMRAESQFFAGPIQDETDDEISLDSPSRVGGKNDFNPELRSKLRVTDIYGFRDGCLDGVKLDKGKIEVYRVEDLE